MIDHLELMQRYDEFVNSYDGPWADLLIRDKVLHRKREKLERELKAVDLEIIRNAHEIAAVLWPVFLEGDKNENVTKLEPKP